MTGCEGSAVSGSHIEYGVAGGRVVERCKQHGVGTGGARSQESARWHERVVLEGWREICSAVTPVDSGG